MRGTCVLCGSVENVAPRITDGDLICDDVKMCSIRKRKRLSPRTTDEVFVGAVRDHLGGTPNASHPVQFVVLGTDDPLFAEIMSIDAVAVCTLCGSLVFNSDKWTDLHRKNHDDHNRVHDGIESQARRYVPEPRYR